MRGTCLAKSSERIGVPVMVQKEDGEGRTKWRRYRYRKEVKREAHLRLVSRVH